jgi:hypothetical protein
MVFVDAPLQMPVECSGTSRLDRHRIRIRQLSDRLIFSCELTTREALGAELLAAVRDARRELAAARHEAPFHRDGLTSIDDEV